MSNATKGFLIITAWTAAALFACWSYDAGAALYDCDGTQVDFSALSLSVGSAEPVALTDSSRAAIEHADGSTGQATAFNFGDRYYFIVGADDSTAALVYPEGKSLFCEVQ